MEEYRKHPFKRIPDRWVFGTVVSLMIGTYLFEFFVILPKIYGYDFTSWKKIAHIAAGTWILVNALASFWKFVNVDPGAGSHVLPSILLEGWRYCWKCEGNFPPRSYHCFQCDTCILVRDHHCVVGINCVGYKTRRYFMQMNFYMWFALFYANILNADFVWELYHNFSTQSLLTMFMPILAWIFGIAVGETFFMAVFTSFCVISFMYSTAVFIFHLKNTVKGRTTNEVMKKTGFMYNTGLVDNLKNAFGKNWKIAWLSPFIPSPLPGDGVSFKVKEMVQQSGKSL
ncbi:unnamed protein product [Clavelina lepadiformis]|uniref:Palmitoyltransferase n=1 Tax=Clavelina lepadiformis TaxID=159417 RepID=A0ABP0F2B1_CLALP